MFKSIQKLIATVTLLCALTCAAQAQRCAVQDSQEEAYARATAVFIGKVTQQGNIFAMTKMGPVTACLVTYTVRFAVEKSYFQAPDPEFNMFSDYPLGDLKEGESYLVYAYEQAGGVGTIFVDPGVTDRLPDPARCSRTRLLSEAQGDLAYLEASNNRKSGVTIRGNITRDQKGKPLSRIRVTVKGDNQTFTSATDAEGRYEVTGLSAGKYRIQIGLPWKLRTSRPTRFITVSDQGRVNESFLVESKFGW